MKRRITAFVAASFLLNACGGQTLMTSGLPRPNTTVKGVPYFLPVGYVPIALSGGPPPKPKEGEPTPAARYLVDVTASPTAYRADANAPLFLNYQHSHWADDQLNVAVDANGLLQSSSTTASDQSGAVALKVAELVGQIITAAAGFGGGPAPSVIPQWAYTYSSGKPPPVTCNLPPFKRAINYYPGHDPKIPPITGEGGQRLDIGIEITDEVTKPTPLPAPLNVDQDGPPAGVLFRRAVVRPYRITVTPNQKAIDACGFGINSYDMFASVPDTTAAGLFWQDTSRASLVKKSVKLTIGNGMLTGVDVDNPSEALAIITLPSDILKAILSIPGSVLTFRLQQMNDKQEISDAQLKAIQSQIDLLQKTAVLQQARSAAGAAPAASP